MTTSKQIGYTGQHDGHSARVDDGPGNRGSSPPDGGSSEAQLSNPGTDATPGDPGSTAPGWGSGSIIAACALFLALGAVCGYSIAIATLPQ